MFAARRVGFVSRCGEEIWKIQRNAAPGLNPLVNGLFGMNMLRVLREVDLTLELAPNMELEACDKACAIAEYVEMSAERVDEIRLAVIEACINAIEHSQAHDGRLFVNIAVMGDVTPLELQIKVSDHGVGFDRSKVVQPRIEEKLKARSKRGWGLRIIEGLMDRVDVESTEFGTSVIMTKAIVGTTG